MHLKISLLSWDIMLNFCSPLQGIPWNFILWCMSCLNISISMSCLLHSLAWRWAKLCSSTCNVSSQTDWCHWHAVAFEHWFMALVVRNGYIKQYSKYCHNFGIMGTELCLDPISSFKCKWPLENLCIQCVSVCTPHKRFWCPTERLTFIPNCNNRVQQCESTWRPGLDHWALGNLAGCISSHHSHSKKRAISTPETCKNCLWRKT